MFSKKKRQQAENEEFHLNGVAPLNIDSELNRGDNAFAQAKFYKVLLIAIFIVTLFNYQSSANLKDRERTNLVPLIGSTMTVGSDFVDTQYLINMITFLNSHYISATPATARVQNSLVLGIVHPTRYAKMQERLALRANKLQSLSNTTLFSNVNWGRVITAKEQREHNYEGILSKMWKVSFEVNRAVITSQSVPDNNTMKIDLFYTVEDGRFWLVDILEKVS